MMATGQITVQSSDGEVFYVQFGEYWIPINQTTGTNAHIVHCSMNQSIEEPEKEDPPIEVEEFFTRRHSDEIKRIIVREEIWKPPRDFWK